MAAHVREMRRSESCKWFPVSAPRPIRNGVCVTRTKRRAPSGETTASTVSATIGTVSGIRPAYPRIVACETARKPVEHIAGKEVHASHRLFARAHKKGRADEELQHLERNGFGWRRKRTIEQLEVILCEPDRQSRTVFFDVFRF